MGRKTYYGNKVCDFSIDGDETMRKNENVKM